MGKIKVSQEFARQETAKNEIDFKIAGAKLATRVFELIGR